MKDNSSGVAGVVLGIVGIATGGFNGILGLIFGIIGLVFSLNQKKHGKNKWSKIGFVLNIIAIILGVLSFIFVVYLLKNPEILAQFKGTA